MKQTFHRRSGYFSVSEMMLLLSEIRWTGAELIDFPGLCDGMESDFSNEALFHFSLGRFKSVP